MRFPRRTLALALAVVGGALAGAAVAASQTGEVDEVRPLALWAPAFGEHPHRGAGSPPAVAFPPVRRWAPPRPEHDGSRALGTPDDGRLRDGIALPPEGRDFLTLDSILERSPSREWRRYATGRLLRVVYAALRDYRRANPGAPRVLIGDLSRPGGGSFGSEYGGLGHASHQNGLDIDLYYPRRDGRRAKPKRASQVDRRLAQELVDAFLARPEVRFAFVGLEVGITGPRRRVQRIPHHDDHVHIRVRPGRAAG